MSVPLARGVAALALTLAVLTGCGGDSDDEAAAPAESSTGSSAPAESGSPAESGELQTLTVTEDDFSISLEEDSLSPGMYEITVVNDGDSTHDLVVERDGEDVEGTDGIQPGESATLMVELESGEYVFYCSIGTHRSMGMEIDVSVS